MNSSLLLLPLSIINLSLLFILQWYVVIKLGTGIATDALFVASSIPQFVVNVIANSLMYVLVPILSIADSIEFRQHTWGLMFIIAGLFLPLTLILILTAYLWVPITVPGFTASAMKLAVRLTQIQLISLVFNAVAGVQWAALHAQKRFIRVEIAALLGNLFGLMVLVWQLPIIGVTAAAWAFTIRIVIQFILLLPGLGHFAWPKQPSILFIQVWQKLSPLLWGTAYYKMDTIIDRWLLSYSMDGYLSLYYLAQQMYAAVYFVLNKATIAPLVPSLTHYYTQQNFISFHHLYQKRIWQLGSLIIVVYSTLFFIGQWIFFPLLIKYSSLTPVAINTLWFIMMGLGGLLIGSILGQITASAFYAQGNTVTPTKITVMCFTIHIPIKVIAFFQFGLVGLALASSAYFLTVFLLQWYYLYFECNHE